MFVIIYFHPRSSICIYVHQFSSFFQRFLWNRASFPTDSEFPNQEQPQMEEESRKEAEEPSCRSFHHFWRGFQMVPRTFVFILVATNLVVDGSRWYYRIPLQYHYHTMGISISFIRHTQPGPDFLEIQPRSLVTQPHRRWGRGMKNHAFLMGFCMKATIQLCPHDEPETENRKPPNLFWRDSSHCFTFLPLGFLEFRGCQFLAVGCLQNWFLWPVRPPVWLTIVTI